MTGSSETRALTASARGSAPEAGPPAVKRVNLVDELGARLEPSRTVVYKTYGERGLRLHVFEPAGHKAGDGRACYLTIHGGGWAGGNVRRFYPFADYFARRGMLAISMEYRLTGMSGVTPFDCVRDGRSAVRYLRAHAGAMGIDPARIAVSGGSAGGHVAAGTALFDGIDAGDDDLAISPAPDALVLYYPVIDTSADGYGQAKCGPRWREISPLHRIKASVPPTLVFHGSGDTVTPFRGVERFREGMVLAGNRCDLVVHEGGVHGYFLYDLGLFESVMAQTAAFLAGLGFLG